MRGRSYSSRSGRGLGGGSPERIQASGKRCADQGGFGRMSARHASLVQTSQPSDGLRVHRPPARACHQCGTILVLDVCSHGECEDRFPDPDVMSRGGYSRCGAPAVAMTILGRRPRCAEHAVKEER